MEYVGEKRYWREKSQSVHTAATLCKRGDGNMVNVYEMVNSKIISALEQGIIPWARPWTGIMPTNYDSGKAYRGVNVWTLTIEEIVNGYSSPYWLTFNQARKHGGYVKRGEKASHIIFSERKVREVEKPDGTTEQKVVWFAKTFPVFNWDQCEGIPEKSLGVKLDPNRDIIALGDNLLANMPNPPKFRESGTKAYYFPAEDLVNLPPMATFHSSEGYVATKFHEFGHATGHVTRLNRPGIMEVAMFGGEDYSFEELVAELTSAYLCATIGIDNTVQNAAAYIQSWLKVLKDDKTMITKASAKAVLAVGYIQKGGVES